MSDSVRSSDGLGRNPFGNPQDMLLPLGVITVVMMIIIPLPTILLDALMAMNLIISLLVLLIVLYTRKAVDFNLFPTVLLVVTVFGLALNVSSTRLILTQGARFNGRMIRAFSSFVVGSGGNEGLVVGFIIFIVIIAVQAVVITKGATRVSEVAARFQLDGMPQKQMSIESEFNSGSITEEEARTRKQELDLELAFYGSMDGASKFISGNVKVGIFITAVNILGGIIIGTVIRGEPVTLALSDYIAFSVGDGLLSQLPSLLISTAMGIVVTRAAAPGNLGEQVAVQFSRDAKVYWVAAAVLVLIALLPGFPWYVLIPMAVLVGFYAFYIGRVKRRKADFDQMMSKTQEKGKPRDEGEISPVVPLDALSLELGYGLIPLVDKDKGAELLERLQGVRRQSGLDLGLVIPKIRIIDNVMLEPSEYCFKIKGVDVGRGKIRLGYYLCIKSGQVAEEIHGEETLDPAFGLPSIWVGEDRREEAERAGYTVVDPPSIIATHLTEIIKRHAQDILGRQEIQGILDTLRKEYPVVVEDALKTATLGDIQKVFQGLLRERVSIRNTVSILEAVADYAPVTRDSEFLIEKARQALSMQICQQYADDRHVLRVLMLDPALEQRIIDSQVKTSSGRASGLDPQTRSLWLRTLSRFVSMVIEQGWPAVILCSEEARALVKSSTEQELPELAVLSIHEVARGITLESVGLVKLENQAAA
ncbi:MAG: flagellar biosynthesis protein FlhA [Treponema sp.]|nr:flagellar biosynthesis protein FlhA [Treponema sp.]